MKTPKLTDGEAITRIDMILNQLSPKQQLRIFNWMDDRIDVPQKPAELTPLQKEMLKLLKPFVNSLIPKTTPLPPLTLKPYKKTKKNDDHFFGPKK